MCLELEAATGERGYNSKSKSNSNANSSTTFVKKMALTDSDETYFAQDEDVSNQSVLSNQSGETKLRKSSKSYSGNSTPNKCTELIKFEPGNLKFKNNATPENHSCPICQEVFPDNHTFTIHIREHNASNGKESHVCQICHKKLSSASSLDRHMYVHSGERPFKCKICDLAFTTNGNMHRHMRTHYSGKRKLTFSGSEKSEDEDAVPPKKAVYRTLDESNSQTFRCPVCCKRFISIESLGSHMESHPNDAIQCWKCSVVSENYSLHMKHACVIPKENGVKDERDCVIGFRDLNFVEFSTKKFSLIAKNVCEEQTRRPASASLAFECNTCNKAFPCARTLQEHELIHDSESITFCNLCKSPANTLCIHKSNPVPLSLNDDLSTNSEKLPLEKDNFLAILNLQKVSPESTNTLQVKKESNVLKPWSSINMSASDKEITAINLKSQTETSNDFADIPSIISLTSKATLPSMRTSPVTATPASPEDNEHCPESPVIEGSANSNFEGAFNEMAGSNFDSDSMTDNTSGKEEKLQCRQCPLTFATTKALRAHARSHSQNGPHCCDFCNYKSVDKSTLLRHMRTHNGERPFKCSLCDYAFTTKANSHRHVKKKHKLPDDQIASAVVYNPNMLESSSSDNVSSENPSETVCKYCNVDFKFSRVLRHHLRSVNNSCARKPFACRNCGLGFSTKNNCIRHINQQHPEYKGNVQDLIIINQSSTSNQSFAKQSAQSSANEASGTEDDESPDLQIVDYENSITPEKPSELDTNEQTSSSFQQTKQCEGESENGIANQTSENDLAQSSVKEDQCHDSVFENQNSCNSEDDRVSIAQSLVSLSECVTFQTAPLDLSVRALDLSSKTPRPEEPTKAVLDHTFPSSFTLKTSNVINTQPAHSSPCKKKFLDAGLNFEASPINLIQNDSKETPASPQTSSTNVPIIVASRNSTTPTPLLLNEVSTTTSPLSPAQSFATHSESICPQTACMSQMKMVKKKLIPNEKSYKCQFCDGKFTLKSNRERHIKKQHPEFARPSRSRNFIPSLPEVEVLKQVQNVSDATKNLLRSVLIPKVNGAHLKQSNADNSVSTTVRNDGNLDLSLRENLSVETPEELMDTSSRNDYENSDLASVSSVIDTANSQEIKKYLTDASVSDIHLSPGKIRSSGESDSEDTSNTGRRQSHEKGRDSLTCEYCNRAFPWVSALDRHMRTHTGVKPYRCLECPVNFSTKSNLDRHLKKKCCDKINYKYNKTLSGLQSERDSMSASDSWTNGLNSEEKLVKHPDDNQHNVIEPQNREQNIITSGVLPSKMNNFSAIHFNTSLNTVAHVASLRLQNLDKAQKELVCEFCENSYNTDLDLTNHMKEIHPFECQSMGSENSGSREKDESDIPRIHSVRSDESIEKGNSNISPQKEHEADLENNLIMNLLGVKDSKVIDNIIDCAARTRLEQKS